MSFCTIVTCYEKKKEEEHIALGILFVEGIHGKRRRLRRDAGDRGALLVGHEVVDDDNEEEDEGGGGRDG